LESYFLWTQRRRNAKLLSGHHTADMKCFTGT
jgi:hypothetical protein